MFEKKAKEEKMAEKPKKDRKKKDASRRSIGLRAVLIPFILASISVVCIYLYMEESTKNGIVFKEIYVAAENIPAHTFIDSNNLDTYLKTAQFDPKYLPDGAVTDAKDIKQGVYLTMPLERNQMVLKNVVSPADPALTKYDAGYQTASIACSSFRDCINGTVRRGDLISIYAVNPSSGEIEKMVSDVYVEEAFDNNGNLAEDAASIATSFTVRITEEESVSFNRALSYGDISIRK